jgi:outer membrane protein assembly factor BamD
VAHAARDDLVFIIVMLLVGLPDVGLCREAGVRLAAEAAPGLSDADLANPERAGREMEVARYYLKKENRYGAINRLKAVVTEYPETPYVEEALEGLVLAYLALGIADEAQTATAVLGRRFPDSPRTRNAVDLLKGSGLEPRENEKSWISRALR